MIGNHFFRQRLYGRWHAWLARLRPPSVATGGIAAIVGGALMLMPAGSAWPNLNIADALASVAILDWAKASLSLIFLLRRRLGTTNGG